MTRGEQRRRFPSMASGLLLLLICLVSVKSVVPNHTTQTAPSTNHLNVPLCRDRQGYFPPIVFNLHSCSMCLHYLLKAAETAEFHVNGSHGFALLQSMTSGQFVLAEPGNHTAMNIVCHSLSKEDCEDWTACCQSAETCCQKQITSSSSQTDNDNDDEPEDGGTDGCPMTWDGFSCVNHTPPGVTASIQCPVYITRFTTQNDGKATRQCWPNATWFTNSLGLEWTDYSSCHKTEDHQTILTLKLVFKGVSVALLLPSIAIFLKFRPLRNQLRIKLHINLFVSLVLTALFSLLWEVLVSRDVLVHPNKDHAFFSTHQGACKFLNISSRCFLMTTFFWMFCEGFYLAWLMVQSFRHISSLRFFALFAWGGPVLFCVIYVIVRVASKDDSQCWVTSAGGLEWLLDGPTVACMALNLLFLVAIMRVMLCQLRTHSSGGGSGGGGEDQRSLALRRSLRALLILIPLFGLQEFCLLYRPPTSAPGFYAYEVVSAAVMNLQGAVVALIFCFFNGEVQGHLKDVYKRLQYKLRGRHGQSRQSLSLASSLQSRPHRPSLASIDTAASVILAPLRLHAGKEGGVHSNGRVEAEDSSWRGGRLRPLEDSIAEHDQESDARFVRTSSDFQSVNTDEPTLRKGLHSNGFRPEEAESCDSQLQTGHKSGTSGNDVIGKKNRALAFFSKLLREKGIFDRNRQKQERQISNTNTFNDSGPANAFVDQCNPAIVISQYEHSSSTQVPGTDGIVSTCSETIDDSVSAANTNMTYDLTSRDLHTVNQVSYRRMSLDDGASSKDSVCGDDSDNRRLVQENVGDNAYVGHDRPRHVHLPHKRDARKDAGLRSFRGVRSMYDDTRCLWNDNTSLQGSDSSASFSSYLPSEADIEEPAEREDQHIVELPVGPDNTLPGNIASEDFSFVNVAFENDCSKS